MMVHFPFRFHHCYAKNLTIKRHSTSESGDTHIFFTFLCPASRVQYDLWRREPLLE